jgi:hypothetical protein
MRDILFDLGEKIGYALLLGVGFCINIGLLLADRIRAILSQRVIF